jgi:hypothetical protein
MNNASETNQVIQFPVPVGTTKDSERTSEQPQSTREPGIGAVRRQLMKRMATGLFAAPVILASLEVRADPVFSGPG